MKSSYCERAETVSVWSVITSKIAAAPEAIDRDFGDLNGQPLSRFEGEPPRRIDVPYPSGESYSEVVERVRDFLDELPQELDGKRIVLIGHAATRWALEHLLVGTPLAELVATPFQWQEGWEYVLRR